MNINWYPGHMAKWRRLIAENVKLVDIIIEIRDARIPQSSTNPDFDSLFQDKYRIVALNKSDFADPAVTKEWVRWFEQRGLSAIPLNSLDRRDVNSVKKEILSIAKREQERVKRKKGINKTIRAMIIGIPNVGKSTFINSIAGGGKAKTGNKPGVTRGKQWVRINQFLELLDTPGLLWPKLEDRITAFHLAYTRSIREEVLDMEEVAVHFLEEGARDFPHVLSKRYDLDHLEGKGYDILGQICIRRGWLQAGGIPDTLRGAKQIMDEFHTGKLGKISLERPPE